VKEVGDTIIFHTIHKKTTDRHIYNAYIFYAMALMFLGQSLHTQLNKYTITKLSIQ